MFPAISKHEGCNEFSLTLPQPRLSPRVVYSPPEEQERRHFEANSKSQKKKTPVPREFKRRLVGSWRTSLAKSLGVWIHPGRPSRWSSRAGHTGGSWVCIVAHETAPMLVVVLRTEPAAGRAGCVGRNVQKGKKASSYTTTAAINQCYRRTVKQYDVASIIDGNPSSAFRDFSRRGTA
ncbi:hypothetical protein KM043_009604 [Ampulex compressa]|nr:hypothetical protein KM043_009604 [Ampulex compressa]